MKHQAGFTHWIIVLLISVMAIGLVGVAWYYEANKETTNGATNTTVATNINTNANTAPTSVEMQSLNVDNLQWQTLHYDTKRGYTIELDVPQTWSTHLFRSALKEKVSIFSTVGSVGSSGVGVNMYVRYYNNGDETFEEWFEKHKYEFELPQWSNQEYKEADITYNSLDFKQILFDERSYVNFLFVPQQDGVYEFQFRITLGTIEPNPKPAQSQTIAYYGIIPAIMESVTFTDMDTDDSSVDGWGTYSSQDIDVSFQYPTPPGDVTYKYSGWPDSVTHPDGVYFYWSVTRDDIGQTYPFASGVNENKSSGGNPFISEVINWTYENGTYYVHMADDISFEVTPTKVIKRPDALQAITFDPNEYFPRFASDPFNPDREDRVAILNFPESPEAHEITLQAISFYFYDETSMEDIERVINSVIFN